MIVIESGIINQLAVDICMNLAHRIICRRSCMDICGMSFGLNKTLFALLGGGDAYIGLESIEAFGQEGGGTVKGYGAESFWLFGDVIGISLTYLIAFPIAVFNLKLKGASVWNDEV